jgi:hypothetical protein
MQLRNVIITECCFLFNCSIYITTCADDGISISSTATTCTASILILRWLRWPLLLLFVILVTEQVTGTASNDSIGVESVNFGVTSSMEYGEGISSTMSLLFADDSAVRLVVFAVWDETVI